jgi:hypothetical protein
MATDDDGTCPIAGLFGPWPCSEGPPKAISDRLLQAHRDHIHVAK